MLQLKDQDQPEGVLQEEVLSEVEVEIRFNFFNVCKLKIEDQIV